MGCGSGPVFFPDETEDSTNDVGGGKFYETDEISFKICKRYTYLSGWPQ